MKNLGGVNYEFKRTLIICSKGKYKKTKELVQLGLNEKMSPSVILNEGLIEPMGEVGVKFKNNEIYVPKILIAVLGLKSKNIPLVIPIAHDCCTIFLGSKKKFQ